MKAEQHRGKHQLTDMGLIHDGGGRLCQAAATLAGCNINNLVPVLEKTGLLQERAFDHATCGSDTIALRTSSQSQSHLNENGTPIQFCLSFRPETGQSEIRLLIDPFFDAGTRDRHARSLSLARQIAGNLGHAGVMAQISQRCIAPAAGTLWLAGRLTGSADPFQSGVAIYLNAEALPGDGVIDLVNALLPHNAAREQLLAQWMPVTRAVCVAVELDPAPSMPRVKLYLRMASHLTSGMLAEFAATQSEQASFDILKPQAPWPATGLTLGLSFSASTGSPDGIKLDFCLCRKCRTAAALRVSPERQLLSRIPRAAPLFDAGTLALLGYGVAGKGQRINAYFAPHR